MGERYGSQGRLWCRQPGVPRNENGMAEPANKRCGGEKKEENFAASAVRPEHFCRRRKFWAKRRQDGVRKRPPAFRFETTEG